MHVQYMWVTKPLDMYHNWKIEPSYDGGENERRRADRSTYLILLRYKHDGEKLVLNL